MVVENKCSCCGKTITGKVNYKFCEDCYCRGKEFFASYFEAIVNKHAKKGLGKAHNKELKCGDNADASNVLVVAENENENDAYFEDKNFDIKSSLHTKHIISEVIDEYMKKLNLVHDK